MKKKTAYLLRILPKGYSNPMDLAFDFLPTDAQVIEALKEKLEATKREDLKKLCELCISGVKHWKLPKITEGDYGTVQWKMKSESIYSSKGLTAIKMISIYQKD